MGKYLRVTGSDWEQAKRKEIAEREGKWWVSPPFAGQNSYNEKKNMLTETQKANLPGPMDQRLEIKVSIVAELVRKDLGNERPEDADPYLL